MYLLLATPQHSGTTFMLEMLKYHRQYGGQITMGDVREKLTDMKLLLQENNFLDDEDKFLVIHSHPPVADQEAAPDRSANLFTMMALLPTLSTIRDPLLSLISFDWRVKQGTSRPNLDFVGSLIMIFEDLVTLQGIDNVSVLPLDILNPEDRVDIISASLCQLGLVSSSGFNRAIKYRWDDTINSIGISPLREAYNNSDSEIIRSELSHEFLQLQLAAPTLQPYLESLGYKDLLWWN